MVKWLKKEWKPSNLKTTTCKDKRVRCQQDVDTVNPLYTSIRF